MGTRILAALLGCAVLVGCGARSSDTGFEPVRDWNGDPVDGSELNEAASPPSSLSLADDPPPASAPVDAEDPVVDEPNGWLNPDFIHRATAPGTRLINFGRLSQYDIVEGPAGLDCAALETWIEAEQNATVDAVTVRGTPGVDPDSAGIDGTLIHAHAVSYAEPAQVPAIAESYASSFVACTNESASATLHELELDGIGTVDVIHVDQRTSTDFRIVVLHRANLLVNVFGWVDPEGEPVFEAFVADASNRLSEARAEEEILPADLR